jgi:hypothetical protein
MKMLYIKELKAIEANRNEKWNNVILKEIEPNIYKLVKAHIEVRT